MHTRRTLLLARDAWDITLDGVGRIALTQGDIATAQNVANECRLFLADACFNQDEGIPHFILQLGKARAEGSLKDHLRAAAKAIPGVETVTEVTLFDFDPQTRALHGTINFTTTGGQYVATDF